MCGIAGTLRFDGRPADPGLLAAMSRCVHHRGPDDAGDVVLGPVGMAFRRLAILDLSPAGHQPMASADGQLTLIFNGEIYNYRQLRAELHSLGHAFRSTSDSEVLLAAYAQWGIACLPRLSGMWAFAIWDAARQRLFCARDRFGIKPFHYHVDARRFLFASELTALLADPATPNQRNDQRVYDFLAFGLVDHTAETMLAEIRQLPPAHYLLATPGQAELTIRRFWDLDPTRRLALSDAEASERFRTLFDLSVARHMQSDVRLGTCLSGGLDSSSIVVTVSQLLGQQRVARTVAGERQATFSAVYADPASDERPYIEAVVRHTGVANAQTWPSDVGLVDDLERFVLHQEQPCPTTSMYAQWCVMRLAREHGVTVLLDGQGADEILAGYGIYQSAWWARLALAGRLGALRREIASYDVRFGTPRALRAREALRLALPAAVSQQVSRVLGHSEPAWLGPALRGRGLRRPSHPSPFGDPLRRTLYTYLTATNLPSLLRYEDRSSMAFAIEARVPFLDERLVELCYALPSSQLLRNGVSKWLLRQAMADRLPPAVRDRRDKKGFATPGDAWARGALAPLIEDALGGLVRRGLLTATPAQDIWQRHRAAATQAGGLLWRWLHLEQWLRHFVDNRPQRRHP